MNERIDPQWAATILWRMRGRVRAIRASLLDTFANNDEVPGIADDLARAEAYLARLADAYETKAWEEIKAGNGD